MVCVLLRKIRWSKIKYALRLYNNNMAKICKEP